MQGTFQYKLPDEHQRHGTGPRLVRPVLLSSEAIAWEPSPGGPAVLVRDVIQHGQHQGESLRRVPLARLTAAERAEIEARLSPDAQPLPGFGSTVLALGAP